ncbi:type 4 prepilin-like proteins leader peptide processing enzyme [Yersinia aldovae]|uniref:Prepilin leader peptidase/N-methyltransferase n=2 Tax=Yersinia aldovae TaxID=29483 RepID=A0A0T9UX29_YERAL|nr:A24 family peptidase [Yersinia aldovae]CNL78749.1 type 4 prepilin-like proteins leader peptide processing enzyme [Yersinia aldovae]
MMNTLSIAQTIAPLWWGSLALLGLCVGSFLNVVIYRLPRILTGGNSQEFNLCLPHSHCPECQTPLKWRDNIPLFSWVWLQGQCRYCQTSISIRYPLVEVITMLVTIFIAAIIPLGSPLLAALLLSWVLIALTMIDIDHLLLPDSLTLPLLWAGLLFHLFDDTLPLSDAVIGAASGYLILWCLYWVFWWATRRETLGYGDFKLLAALGAWLGWMALPSLLLTASLTGITFAFAARLFRGRSLNTALPFGPFLAFSGWLLFLQHYH